MGAVRLPSPRPRLPSPRPRVPSPRPRLPLPRRLRRRIADGGRDHEGRLAAAPGALARTLVAAVFAFPLYWMLVTATGPKGSAYQLPPRLIPGTNFSAFATIIEGTHWSHYMLNSLFITGVTIVLVIATCSLAGYALVALPMRGKGLWFLVLIGALLLPEQALIIPQYVVNYHLGLLNTYAVMIVPFAANSSAVFLFRQYFSSMPPEWREAARVEGVGTLRYMWRVALPTAKPVVFTVILVTFIASWNQFQWPLIMTQSRGIAPIELALNHYQASFETSQGSLAAVSLLALLPIVIVFGIAQRHIVRAMVGMDTGVEE